MASPLVAVQTLVLEPISIGQPAERLWSLSYEALANEHFRDLDTLLEAQAERCRKLADLPDIIRAQTQFHGWSTIA